MTDLVRASPPAPVVRRPGGRSARVRRAVFDATLDLLARDGYRDLSVEAVAAAAGVNKTTVYRNWPTKAALILAAAEARSAALITTRSTGDAERDLVAFLVSVAESVTSPLGRALVVATLNEADDPEMRRARRDFWQHRFNVAGDVVRASFPDRVLADSEVDHIIEMLIGPLFLRAFVTGGPVDRAFLRRTVRAALPADPHGP